MERATGFEPATSTLGRWHSTTELRPPTHILASGTGWCYGGAGPATAHPALSTGWCFGGQARLAPTTVAGRLPGPGSINIIGAVAFKQNIPVVGLLLFVAAVFLAWALLRPPPEDLLRDAALEWAQKNGPVADVRVRGTVAEIRSAPDARPQFVEFILQDGRWVFRRDLHQEFVRTVKEPAVEREIIERLGRKLADRYRVPVNISSGLQYEYAVDRDEQGIVGHYMLGFAFPKVGERQRRGRYIETFRHQDGRWTLEGAGRLLESPQ